MNHRTNAFFPLIIDADAGTTPPTLLIEANNSDQKGSVAWSVSANSSAHVAPTVIDLTGSDHDHSSEILHDHSSSDLLPPSIIRPLILNPSGVVQPDEDPVLAGLKDSIQSISMNEVSGTFYLSTFNMRYKLTDIAFIPEVPNVSTQSQSNTEGFKVPYYEDLENLGVKEEGRLYRVEEKTFQQDSPYYDEYEFVSLLKDSIYYKCFDKVTVNVRDNADMYHCRIYLDHREAKGWYFLKYEDTWARLESQGRAQCFERALSSRDARMVLARFKDELFKRTRNERGKINPVHLLWHGLAEAMKVQPCHVVQCAGSKYEDEPRWMVIEGVNEESTHRFIYEYGFNIQPMEPHNWTDLINAFVHFTYQLSGGKSLIAKLNGDARGQITNVVIYDKEYVFNFILQKGRANSDKYNNAFRRRPFHSQTSQEMMDKIKNVFEVHFPYEHKCNLICQHIGDQKLI
ncbi:uncharacterized protein MELLADRAFT_111515 [Melampsora larici-populina 98AG31]|uniref:Alpha-type protein kinase domain-containing protein n=1 Tax=Melampsora larici-populina (strain 98AG31 / pathotype 3-4-7) TaxID=747676 RepID=F4S3F8_MELLP|nr:uncharacterized protein MELLADRAFT_111515 [Melampsora larici-populina 98AG31]EGG00802.1 hypothetical protein MELLADRAFT_111515 [Melampsora larici-populina 98AG31]